MLRCTLLSALFGHFALVVGCSSTNSESISNGGTSARGSAASAGSGSTGGGSSYDAAGSTSQNSAGQPSGGVANSGAGAAGVAGTASGGTPGAGGAPSGGASGGVGGRANGGGGPGGGSAGSSGGTPSVRIVGRTAPGNGGAVRFSWPGVSINARFTGTGVSMNVNDGNSKNRFTVVVDGGTPHTVITTSGQSQLALAAGLPSGAHDLVVWRNTEASIGVTEFTGLTGFGAGGALLPAAAAPDRRIEVIGDSLSVGAGVEGTSTNCNPGIDAFTNNYLAYGSVAARSVKADIVTIAWSGIGVYVSYGGTAPTMPARYDYAIPNDKIAWDFAEYQPHVVVLNLGTNDFANGNPGQPYVDAYVNFIEHVRSKYATAKFILIDMYGGDRSTAINSVVSTLKKGGMASIEALSFSSVPNNNTACNSHPNAAAQNAMGAILAARLETLLSW